MSFVEKVQVRYRPADTDGAWSYYEVSPRTTTLDIPGVAPGKAYRIEARSVSSCGAKSAWVAVTHTVDGLASAPDAPSGLIATAVADGVALGWSVGGVIASNIAFEVWVSVDGINFTRAARLQALSYTYPVVDAIPRHYKVRAINTAGGVSGFSNTVSAQAVSMNDLAQDIADALQTAMNAQATADHMIQIYYQTSAPTGVSYGDVWIDTNDLDSFGIAKGYRWNGGAWLPAVGDALVDALLKAITGDAKADGKVQTFFQNTPPPANTGTGAVHPPWPLAIGDLWFDTNDKKLMRWNGSTWSDNVGDVTIDQLAGTGVNILWDEYASLAQTTLPVLTPSSNVTPSYDANLSVGYPVGSLRLTMPLGTNTSSNCWCYFGNTSADYNVPVHPGKSYIISAYFFCNAATSNNARFQFQLRGENGSLYGTDMTAIIGATNTWVRLWNRVTLPAGIDSAELLLWTNRANIAAPYSVWVDRVMIEEQVGNKIIPSTWSPGAAGRQALIAIQNAAFAQEAADGKITTFFQASPPTVHALGDIWFDTDDGNKIYRWSGSAWVAAPDSRIAQAIIDAAGAQATADGKVQTFYQSTAPVATGVGDLWFNTVTYILKRWSGSAWVDGPGTVNPGTIINGVINGNTNGRNLIQNPGFNLNVGNHDSAFPPHAAYICDGWGVSYTNNNAASGAGQSSSGYAIGVQRPTTGHGAGTGTSANSYSMEFIAGNGTSIANGITARAIVFTKTQPVASPGDRYTFGCWMRSVFNASFPANVTPSAFIQLHALRGDNSIAGTTTVTLPRSTGTWIYYSGELTCPDDTVKIQVNIEMRITNNSGATYNSGVGNIFPWIVDVDDVNVSLKPNMDIDIDDGIDYTRFGIEDSFFTGGKRRFGLRFGPSGHQVGDVRNFYNAATASYVAVRTSGALIADSLGRVSVLAHTIRYGGVSVSYSAVTNAVTGLAQNATYVIYCQDSDYSGGVKSYAAGANPAAVMAISPYVVVMGQITIPTGGTSTGGGGSGGGGGWCVAVDQYMPEGYTAEDVEQGDFITCWDEKTDNPGTVYSQVLACPTQDDVECLCVVSASGASLVASTSTPFTLRDGSEVPFCELGGVEIAKREVLVLHTDDGKADLAWEPVVALYSVGKRTVKKINLGNKTYFAGGHPMATIASHNIKMDDNAP